jgi:hypothetical protein
MELNCVKITHTYIYLFYSSISDAFFMNFNGKRGCFYIFKIFTNHQILLCNLIFFFF